MKPDAQQPRYSMNAGRFAFMLLLPFSLQSGIAQIAPLAPPDPPKENAIVLSPFEVSEKLTVGYLANDTLAGTRINTKLKDVANSVQVVTKEFLEDTGATSYGDLLIYTTSTEVGGLGGNATLDQLDSGTQRDEFSRREPQFFTRVRGLARLDLARDYFLSDIALDTYISSEVTINRGPNASLFGLGSPGGISNAAVDRAMTDRSFGEINFRTDNYGTFRKSLNYNQVLLKGKLALRVAALNNDQRFEQNQAKFKDERYFIAATWRPMKNFAVRANYEKGDGFGNRPVTRLPTDRITPWLINGKPAYNPLTNQWFINNALVTNAAHVAQLNASSSGYTLGTAAGAPVIVFNDPNSSTPGTNGYAVIQAGLVAAAAGRTATSLPIAGNVNMRQFMGFRNIFQRDPAYIQGTRPGITNAALPYYNDVQLTDFSVFNPRKNSLTGASEWESQNFEIYSFRAEKTWLDNRVGLELAYQKQSWESDHMVNMSANSGGNLSVDINTVLLDGSPNPNFGRPFIGGRGFAQGRIREREAAQAIGFAKYDFAEKNHGWLKHFGKHTLTAVFQDQSNDELQPNRVNAVASNAYNTSIAQGGPGLTQANSLDFNSVYQGNNRPQMVQYLGPSMAGISSIQQASIQGVTVPQTFQATSNALRWNPYTAKFEKGSVNFFTNTDNPDQVWVFGNPRAYQEIKSISSVLQSQFLGGHLVTTASWRRDAVKSYVANGSPDPATRQHSGVPVLGAPIYDDAESQTSFGVVGHVPAKWLPKGMGLSTHYVDSQNFAAGAAGVDIFNRTAPLQAGTTKEYGFAVTTLGGKLYGRVNFYETSQQWEALTGVLPQIGNTIKLVMENNTPAALAAAGWDLYNGKIFNPGTITALGIRPLNPGVPNNQTTWNADNIAGTSTKYFQNTSSTGMEVEVTYAPTSNWRMAFNASKTESTVSNVMPIAGPELNRVATEVFLNPKFANLFITPNPTLQVDGSYLNTDLLSSQAGSLRSAIALRRAKEGGPLQEIRKWRYNFVNNYKFGGPRWSDSWLKGFSVGAALRWQDKVAIGNPLKVVNGATIPDFDQQYFGPSETNVDTWITYDTKVRNNMGLQLQFRIRNVTSGSGDLIPVAANPDGEVALWRLGQPTSFELSARLKF
ncbi:MAG: hypothetical protein Q8N18_22155 [Opitutaceae bacterium]|nr:hypothetical protein [Opitutaceae bacterium]